MNSRNLVIGIVIVGVLAFVALFLPTSRTIIQRITEQAPNIIGAIPGGEVQGPEFKVITDSPLTEIYRATTTTATFTSNAITLTEADLNKGIINFPITSNSTATLPATSTLTTFARNQAAKTEVVVNNVSNSTLTLAPGAGMQFRSASTTLVTGSLTLEKGASAILTFLRSPTTTPDMIVLVDMYRNRLED